MDRDRLEESRQRPNVLIYEMTVLPAGSGVCQLLWDDQACEAPAVRDVDFYANGVHEHVGRMCAEHLAWWRQTANAVCQMKGSSPVNWDTAEDDDPDAP